MVVLLACIGIILGLLGYEFLYLPRVQTSDMTTVFVASEDIPTSGELNEENVSAVQIPSEGVLPGMATSPDEIIGNHVVAGLNAGEAIFTQRMTSSVEEGELYVRVEPDYQINLSEGDQVRVIFQQGTDFQVLFERKTVHSADSVVGSVVQGQASGFYFLMTEDEVENYYTAKENGRVIFTQIDNLATNEDISSGEGTTELELNENVEESSEDEVNLLRYTVEDGETVESISEDLNVDIETIQDLNADLSEIEAGDILVVPGE